MSRKNPATTIQPGHSHFACPVLCHSWRNFPPSGNLQAIQKRKNRLHCSRHALMKSAKAAVSSKKFWNSSAGHQFAGDCSSHPAHAGLLHHHFQIQTGSGASKYTDAPRPSSSRIDLACRHIEGSFGESVLPDPTWPSGKYPGSPTIGCPRAHK